MAEKSWLQKRLNSLFTNQEDKGNDGIVLSPVAGSVLALEDVADPVFASGAMGTGFAVEPEGSQVFAPVSGEVTIAFETGHAYGLRTPQGVELLVHIGIDTVSLEGKGFTPKVTQGQEIQVGQLLAEFDPAVLAEAGLKATTMVIVTSMAEYKGIEGLADEVVKDGEPLFVLKED